MTKPKHAWMVRAGSDNSLADFVEEKNAVAIGWHQMGDIGNLTAREAVIAKFEMVYPTDSKPRISVNSGQLYRFAQVIQSGDYVITYLKASREILIGAIESDYIYDPETLDARYPHVRHVKWLRKVSRDDFSASARNTLGSTLTVFSLDNILIEIHSIVSGKVNLPVSPDEEQDEPPFYEEVKAKSEELIEGWSKMRGPPEGRKRTPH